ncbi:S1/P1 nuclease [Maribacter sp. 4G9]|uniref:S1/P1 nuclease n=1 Tax=Maribacter sp. 4G9 TaxID=1889777 RepID=UPI000C1471CB|nr:S1/P1 nuclease [Maribacter sp. 4G9]PIB29487.1 S1/P1 Nuclease [Maribacter sp. 4G9]
MKKLAIIFLVVFQCSFANDAIWSKTGHRVIGDVAQEYISRKARKAIEELLDGQSLASVSNFADEIKADRKYSEFSAWHYVNFPADKDYNDVEPSEYGDLVIGINKCIEIITSTESSKEDKAFYLKFLVHLIGDLHQPMHIGRLEDKGGNDIQLQWFGRGSNLHRVWDSNMIDDYGMSFTELSNSLPKLSKQQVKQIQQGDIYDWIEETQEITNEVYDSTQIGEKLGYQYSYRWWGTVENQLQKGGIRLAAVLNQIFG